MDIKFVTDESFRRFGQVLENYDLSEMVNWLEKLPVSPEAGIVYEPSVPELEAMDVSRRLQDNFYGGLSVETGYCMAENYNLTFLEYHRGCEINITTDDVLLLVAPKQEMDGNSICADRIEAFLLKAGQGVAMYETTLHSAPCCIYSGQVARTAVVLPAGTNMAMPEINIMNEEDRLLFARNKWMVVTEDSPEAENGAVPGIIGKPDMQHIYAQLREEATKPVRESVYGSRLRAIINDK